MAQLLRALAVLAGDLSLVASPWFGLLTGPCNSSPTGSDRLLDFSHNAFTCVPSYTQVIKNKLLETLKMSV